MNNKDYEQKRRECWEEFRKDNIAYDLPYCHRIYEIAFDRAYALGKQTETVTQEDVGKAAEKYDDQHTEKLIHDMHNDSTSWEPLQDGIRNAFLAGANFALGKQ